VWAGRRWLPGLLRPLGVVALLAAAVGLAVAIGRDLPEWLQHAGAENQHHWPKRVAYRLATLTDVPLVQGLLAGASGFVLGGRSRTRRPAATGAT
jgi:hypothetical protein